MTMIPEDAFEGGYYVYGLIDPFALQETDDQLLSIFYVGKGKDLRWAQHEKDVRQSLEKEVLRLERRGSKAERIRKVLERGGTVSAMRLSGGYANELDAYRAESLAIDLVGAQLAVAGRPPLTNATPGHHAGFIALGEHFKFVTSQQDDVDAVDTGVGMSILVKGTTEPLKSGGHRVLDAQNLPSTLTPWRDQITVLSHGFDNPSEQFDRPGWDPNNPWSDIQARERASRYWQLGVDRVSGWLRDPSTAPKVLLLGIPTGGETVIRFAWEVASDTSWEFFPDNKRWGVPLGRRLHQHPRLGKALYENRNGKRVQVLANYS
ncbi:MAG: GIY-YIG nuclease family protein [Rhodococcus sp. (in: high G+C Gram-positive bacteria)]